MFVLFSKTHQVQLLFGHLSKHPLKHFLRRLKHFPKHLPKQFQHPLDQIVIPCQTPAQASRQTCHQRVSCHLLFQVDVCQLIHSSVAENSVKYLAELNRRNYVTPTSYLELLGIFNKLIVMKKMELVASRNRTKTGLDKVSLNGCVCVPELDNGTTSAISISLSLYIYIYYMNI